MVVWAAILGARQGFGLYWIGEARADAWTVRELALFAALVFRSGHHPAGTVRRELPAPMVGANSKK